MPSSQVTIENALQPVEDLYFEGPLAPCEDAHEQR